MATNEPTTMKKASLLMNTFVKEENAAPAESKELGMNEEYTWDYYVDQVRLIQQTMASPEFKKAMADKKKKIVAETEKSASKRILPSF